MHHLKIILLVTAFCYISQTLAAHVSSVSDTATTGKPQSFSARSIYGDDEEEEEFDSQAQTHLAYRQQPQHQHQHQHQQHQQHQQQQQPLYDYSQSEEVEQEEAPRQIYQSRSNVRPQNNYVKNNKPLSEEETEEAEEVEEPDRLSMLLAKSTFSCNSKNSGYYADESLSCEVFHYCQDSQRHSWICPEGFSFHQIHLICMPPSTDNICQQSSKYQFVNDYLYKPINLQEHQSKPNVTLRYSNRYFPDSYHDHYDDADEEEEHTQRVQQHRNSVAANAYRAPQTIQTQTTNAYSAQPQRHTQYQQQSREEPIPQVRQQVIATQLPRITPQYRRPAPAPTTTTTTTPAPVAQQRTPTYAPYISPTPYRFYTASPQLSQQQVYRTPEEINISLQQRRPQFFVATQTPRYYDEDYLYERRK